MPRRAAQRAPDQAVASHEIRVALVGYGLAGRVFHAPLISATPGMRITAVVTSDATRQSQARQDLPDAAVISSAADLWARASAIDLLVVATSTPSHSSVALPAMRLGVGTVVVEKPVVPTANAARRMAAEAAEHEATVVPFHNRRWDSDQLTLQRLVADGTLGAVLRHESRFERWRPAATAGAWREATESSQGGGVLMDLGVHLIDQSLQLFGSVTAVYCEMAARRGGADDDVFIALLHQSGVTSHLWASAVAAARGPRRRVLGDAAAFVVDSPDSQEEALRAGVSPGAPGYGIEPPERWGSVVRGDDIERCQPERGDWPHFYAAVVRHMREGAPPPVSLDDAIVNLVVIDAARRSAHSRTLVRL